MVESLDKLISRRANYKGRMTRIYNYIDRLEEVEKSYELQVRQAELTELYKKYNLVQDDIEYMDDEKPERKFLQEQERSSTEEKYFEHQARITELLKQHELNQSDSSTHSYRQPSAQKSITTKIPTLQIPHFNNDLNQWANFKSLFEGVIDANEQLTSLQKLQYLKSLLEGEAAGLISSIAIHGDNYLRALDILSKSKLVTIHVPYKIHTIHHHHKVHVPVVKEVEVIKEVPVYKHVPYPVVQHVPVPVIKHVEVEKKVYVPVHEHHEEHHGWESESLSHGWH